MTLGETIKLLRTELGLTQPELADRARIEQSYLSKLENDKGTPSFDIINRIAQALNLTGMALIHKLSHSYIAENLSHLPEIAAEYASIKQKVEMTMTRRLLAAALLLLVGTGLYLISKGSLLDSDEQHFYVSQGILLPGEHVDQFVDHYIDDIGETQEELQQRLLSNRGRFDPLFQTSDRNRGRAFILDLPDGKRRYFQYAGSEHVPSKLNQTVGIIGQLCALSGLLLAVWTVWRGRNR